VGHLLTGELFDMIYPADIFSNILYLFIVQYINFSTSQKIFFSNILAALGLRLQHKYIIAQQQKLMS
jgi:hypothetical protein